MEDWLNLKTYSLEALILTIIGGALWATAYLNIILGIFKYKYVDVPIIAVCANIAWEFLWGFVLVPDLGKFFLWGFRVWFFLDLFIFAGLFLYGKKQISFPFKTVPLVLLISGASLAWFLIFYFFAQAGFDTKSGAVAAYLDNTMMAALYVSQRLRDRHNPANSFWTGLQKFLGTALISIALLLTFPQNYFLLTLCAVTFCIDFWYLLLFERKSILLKFGLKA